MLKKVVIASGIVVGLAAIVVFFALEDMSAGVVWMNSRSPFFVGAAGLSIVALILFFRKKSK